DAQQWGIAAVVCDGATEADLAVIAAASLALDDAFWVGSAGLAAALAGLMTPTASPQQAAPPSGPVLTVVGSLAEQSRGQARMLADSGLARRVVIMPEDLLAGREVARAVTQSVRGGLEAGHDVLLEIAVRAVADLGGGRALVER